MANKETKELARLYFMRGETQKSIANKIGVTEKTVSRWVDKEGWAEKRAAENITRPELVNKLLITINKLIEQVNESDDPDLISGLGDKLSKLSTTIEKLDKKANVVDAIEVFMAFGKWMQYRSSFDSEITPELLKAINKYQDLYISEQISKKP
ncbi:MAG: terminase [Patescibacteria group bacterium]|nr:terminase [Patescibacteria group bacterium]